METNAFDNINAMGTGRWNDCMQKEMQDGQRRLNVYQRDEDKLSPPRSLLSQAIEGSNANSAYNHVAVLRKQLAENNSAVVTPRSEATEAGWGFYSGNSWTPNVSITGGKIVNLEALFDGEPSMSPQNSWPVTLPQGMPPLRRVGKTSKLQISDSKSQASTDIAASAHMKPAGPVLHRQPHVNYEPSQQVLENTRHDNNYVQETHPTRSPQQMLPGEASSPGGSDQNTTSAPTEHLNCQQNLDDTSAVNNANIDTDEETPPQQLIYPHSTPQAIPRRNSEENLRLHRPNKQTVGQRSNPESSMGRRCMSNREFAIWAPNSLSPCIPRRHQKELLEVTMQQRLMTLRESSKTLEKAITNTRDAHSPTSSTPVAPTSALRLTNSERKRRRAEHNRAVVEDLCDIVSDLYLAESKLVHPPPVGHHRQKHSTSKELVQAVVHEFITALPLRYALSVDTPSEVLVHMRLMAAARANDTKAAVNIVNMEECPENHVVTDSSKQVRLVTISCADATGLLEYLTKLLASGGSRVIDADVMLSRDNIVLDRFTVEMKGRLRLDKLQKYIESYLRRYREMNSSGADDVSSVTLSSSPEADRPESPGSKAYGPLYFDIPSDSKKPSSKQVLKEQLQSAVPLANVLSDAEPRSCFAAQDDGIAGNEINLGESAVDEDLTPPSSSGAVRQGPGATSAEYDAAREPLEPTPQAPQDGSPRRPLVNRPAVSSFDAFTDSTSDLDQMQQQPSMHFIPLDELLISGPLGKGRVSTVYRAIWQPSAAAVSSITPGNQNTSSKKGCGPVEVALKVATLGPDGSGMADIEELEREAEIASQLHHDNMCKLVGVTSESDCFCLAYEYCEGGTLSSLLADTSRCYEYLPIALDIASGMAYLHSMNVIHRDLKPSNILLTRDNRAKVSDFGMSVANTGQELTAETGTYRWMAPEVIRHESYSSNADVYSFGLVLWQLITRKVPFATKTPVQAAYAVAEGHRPELPRDVPKPLRRIIEACWDEDHHRRPSFTYITMALADYAKTAFDPASVGIQTVRMADELLASVEGNSTVNVDSSAPVSRSFSSPALSFSQSHQALSAPPSTYMHSSRRSFVPQEPASYGNSDVGLEF